MNSLQRRHRTSSLQSKRLSETEQGLTPEMEQFYDSTYDALSAKFGDSTETLRQKHEIAMRMFQLRGIPSRSPESRKIWHEILELRGR